jgi:hypothetical protein
MTESVYCFVTGLAVRGPNPGEGTKFSVLHSHLNWPSVLLSLLTMDSGGGVFPWGEAAGAMC